MDGKKTLKDAIIEAEWDKNMIFAAVPMLAIEIAAIVYALCIHAWWPVFAYLGIAVIWAVPFSRYYFTSVAYICPECNHVFKPYFKEAFFANHTPTTRKLTCTSCGHHGFCVETAAKSEETGNA